MRWIPLESNPAVFNQFMEALGVKEHWRCVDVCGTDPELQAMVPTPIISLLLLYPLTDNVTTKEIGMLSMDEQCYFIKQTISNACGTIAMLHAIANNRDSFDIRNMPWLDTFLKKTCDSSPAERAALLETEEELSEVHETCAQQGQTDAPDPTANLNLHFVAFVNSNDRLIELDGRREGPIFHGETSSDTFFADACKVVDRFMKRDPENVNFSLIALAKSDN